MAPPPPKKRKRILWKAMTAHIDKEPEIKDKRESVENNDSNIQIVNGIKKRKKIWGKL